jgi:hypothetical protein
MAGVNEPLGRPLLRGGGDVRVDLGKYGTVQGFCHSLPAARSIFTSVRRNGVSEPRPSSAVANRLDERTAPPLRLQICGGRVSHGGGLPSLPTGSVKQSMMG